MKFPFQVINMMYKLVVDYCLAIISVDLYILSWLGVHFDKYASGG